MNLFRQIFAAFIAYAASTTSAQTTTNSQPTEAPATIRTEGHTTAPQPDGGDNPRLRPAPRPKAPPEGTVWPTAAGQLGGATSATETMPTVGEELIEWRRPFLSQPEFRGAWITRFDWAGRGTDGEFDAEAAKEKIVNFMQTAKDLRLNAVVFQVRGDATTLYPSQLEPWSQLVGGKDPGFDPCKFAIEEAHKRGLEFHAYINPIPVTEERTTVPASADHIFFKHCMPDSQPNWLVHKDGKIAPSSGYKWLNPNLPEVQTYLRHVVLDLVKRYDIDGVHYDRIRLPSPDVSDDQWSKARFAGEGNPNGLNYQEWQTENISRLIADLYGQIMEIKPEVKVSAAVWGIYNNQVLPQGIDHATGYSWTSSGLQDYAQDSVGWANEGSMDALIPMIYWSMGDMKPDYDELLQAFMDSVHNGRHVYGGQSVFSKEEMLRQNVATNLIGAQGTVPFTLRSISREGMADYYKHYINPTDAKVPVMPWKNNPMSGHVIATVLDADGKPVTDAHVKLAGRDYTYVTTDEGTCAILTVKPGTASIEAKVKGLQVPAGKVDVTAGKVSRVTLQLQN